MHVVTYLSRENFVDKLPFLLVLIFTSISNITSGLTVWRLIKSRTIQGNEQIRANRTKSTIKITILNAANTLWIGLVIFRMFTDNKSKNIYTIQTVMGMHSIIQSAYNPVVFVLLTENVLSSLSRVGEGNRTS